MMFFTRTRCKGRTLRRAAPFLLLLASLVLAAGTARAGVLDEAKRALDTYIDRVRAANSNVTVYIQTSTDGFVDDYCYANTCRTPVHPASTAKLVTVSLALQAIEARQLALTDEVVIPRFVTQLGGTHPLPLREGQRVTIHGLIGFAIVASNGDAAAALAYALTQGKNPIIRTNSPVPPPNASGNDKSVTDWIQAFGEVMTQEAKKYGAEKTTFCNPYGTVSITGSAGVCSVPSTTTAYDMVKIAQGVVSVNSGLGGASGALQDYFNHNSERLYNSNSVTARTKFNGPVVDTRVSTASTLYGGFSLTNRNNIKLVKTGTVDIAKNIVAVSSQSGSGLCRVREISIAVMGLSNGRGRQGIIGDLIEIVSKAQVGDKQCDIMAYNGASGLQFASAIASVPAGRQREESVTRMLMADGEYDAAIATVSPEQTLPNSPTDVDLPDVDTSASISTAEGEDADCDEEIEKRFRDAEKYRFTTVIGAAQARVSQALQEQILGNTGCLNKFLEAYDKIDDAIEKLAALKGNPLTAAVELAVRKIVRAVMKQIFDGIVNSVCNVSSKVFSYLKSGLESGICFKKPLFTNPLKPFDVNLGLRGASCAGFAVDLTAVLGDDPNAPLTRGQIFGVDPDVRKGDLEWQITPRGAPLIPGPQTEPPIDTDRLY